MPYTINRCETGDLGDFRNPAAQVEFPIRQLDNRAKRFHIFPSNFRLPSVDLNDPGNEDTQIDRIANAIRVPAWQSGRSLQANTFE